MHCIYTPASALHNPPFELIEGQVVTPHESQQRADIIHAAIRQAQIGPISEAADHGRAPIEAIHSPDYLDYLEHIYVRWVAAGGHPAAALADTLAVRWMRRPSLSPLALPGYYAYDLSSAIVAGTYQAAYGAAQAALTAASLLRAGERAAYALCRPPGHHAGRDLHGGYCYLNNAAIAAQFLRQAGQPVAVLDIDFHHGNGTQQIFYGRGDLLTVSIHGSPDRVYPYFLGFADELGEGEGEGANLNIPLEKGTTNGQFLAALEQALERVAQFGAAYLVISTGLDTFGSDPLGDFALTSDAYAQIGARIAQAGLPTLFVQEGGYAVAELGTNVVGLLAGFEGTR
ncbi:histone deacetylase family protein [Chloroflexia bacterium SDU3-3]|nr:histone deacetylase family protein [Chloroflexia bacterium SDU3-3]